MAVDPVNRRTIPAGAVARRGAHGATVQGHLVGSVLRIKSRIVSRMNSAGVIPLVCADCLALYHSGSEKQPLKQRLCPTRTFVIRSFRHTYVRLRGSAITLCINGSNVVHSTIEDCCITIASTLQFDPIAAQSLSVRLRFRTAVSPHYFSVTGGNPFGCAATMVMTTTVQADHGRPEAGEPRVRQRHHRRCETGASCTSGRWTGAPSAQSDAGRRPRTHGA